MPTFKENIKLGTRVPLIKKEEIDNLDIGNAEIQDGAITNEKIASNTITKDKLSPDVQEIIDGVSGKLDKSSVVQSTGTSEEKVMSQRAVTRELDGIHNTTDIIISVLVKNGFNIDLTSSKGWTFSYRSITQSSEDGTYKPFTTLSVDAKWYAQDITDKVYNVSWSRDSGNAEADEAWNKLHANSSLSLPITYDDLGGYSYVIGNTSFTCTAEYDADGERQKAQKTVCF